VSRETEGLRLAELISALAFATDLARGQPMEHELLGLEEDQRSDVSGRN
jgi:hypothetical protein